ncbi:alpha/beta fold hydrolase [Nitrosococcus wardiae]|uniref:Alpha/beta hydrolase n=1 Tax=Nitrosococcus wardiae TaxID=1814290 RepID=A0A4P7BYN0_9GAMM|nr:alpha/beta hydrolase [Nitrosococcus wardiae]QBQ55298.1 alpha/beta hydrolase [Nitrosococcus wardiae]
MAPIETHFVSANGLCFEVDQCGSGDRLALCLHGFPECSYSWRYQMPLLAERGYRVWAPNLRGYGRSSRPSKVADYHTDLLLADIAALIEASHCQSVLLIGHDWGAALAWLFAIGKVRPLEGLIIMNVPHPVPFLKCLKTWRQLRKSWYILFFQIPWLPEWLLSRGNGWLLGKVIRYMAVNKNRFPDDVVNVYRHHGVQPGALRAMVNYYRALFRKAPWRKHHDYESAIEVPTLMIWGEEDLALGKETTYGTEHYVNDLTLHYLSGVSHWVQQEAPEQVNNLIIEWLSKKIKTHSIPY